MHINAAIIGRIGPSQDLLVQGLPADHGTGRLQQHFEQIKLHRRQVHGLPLLEHTARMSFQDDVIHMVLGRYGRRILFTPLELGAPKNGLDAGHQFPGIERFPQIIISTDLQANNAIDLIAPRGQHQYRYIALLADLSEHFEPAAPRQHNIQNDQGMLPSQGPGQA